MLRTLMTITAVAAGLSAAAPLHAQETPEMTLTPAESGYAPVEGGEVFYQVHGEGEPLVLLHGGVGAFEMLAPIVPALSEGRQVIGIDLDGHGRTLPLDRPASFSALAADVVAVLDHLGHERADVMGYSFGGMTALRTGIDHPERVRALVLVSTPFARAGWHDYNLEGMDSMGADLAEAMKPTPMYELYEQIAPDPDNWPRLLDRIGAYVQIDYDWSGEVRGLDMPVLLAVGDWDSVRIGHAAQFFELLGGSAQDAQWDRSGMNTARLAVIPDATHYDVFMSPMLVEAVTGFLGAR